MKRSLIYAASLLGAALLVWACGKTVKEIPTNQMAAIVLKMAMENKIEKDQHPKDIADDIIEPYAKAEGFTAADFKHTAELIDKDQEKQKAFEETMGRMMMDEMMKALGGSGMGDMAKGLIDSMGAKAMTDTAAH